MAANFWASSHYQVWLKEPKEEDLSDDDKRRVRECKRRNAEIGMEEEDIKLLLALRRRCSTSGRLHTERVVLVLGKRAGGAGRAGSGGAGYHMPALCRLRSSRPQLRT